MAGLLGYMAAGAAKGYTDSRVSTLEKQEDFNLKKMLMDAEVEKTMMLKKLGYELDDERAAKQAEKRAGYFDDVEEAETTPESVINKYVDENGSEQVVKAGGETVSKKRPASASDAAERAFRSGDFESGTGLLQLAAKDKKGYESHKMDDGSVISFNKDSGKAEIAIEGSGSVTVPKNEAEILWRAASGDKTAIKAANLIVEQKKAGRALGSEGQKPADVKAAEWLVENGVANSKADAWSMVKQTKEKSPAEAIANIATKLMSERQYRNKPEKAATEAKRIFSLINSNTEDQGTGIGDDPLGLRSK